MDAELNTLCNACLSNDRKIEKVSDDSLHQCFYEIIEQVSMPHNSTAIWLCYYCCALIRRYAKFKKQAKQSYKILQNTKLNNDFANTNTSETNLQIHTQFNITLRPSNQNDTICIETIKTECHINVKEEADSYSDNDDTLLIEYSIKKKKQRSVRDEKRKKRKSEVEFKEIRLNENELEEERRLLSLQEDYVNAMFKCQKCITSFTNADDFNDHVKIKHDQNASLYKCNICECSFSSEMSYNYHSNKHTKRYECAHCMDRFTSKRGVLKHIEFKHQSANLDYGIYENEQENGDIERDKNVENDSEKLEEASFPCEYCNKAFRWKTSLRKHIETHKIESGQKRKPYCEPCRLSFTTTSNLQKHVKTSSKHQIQLKLRKLKESLPEDASPEKEQAHLEQIKCLVNNAKEMYGCSQCGKRFQWRGNLLRHQHSHTARANGELVCKPCNQTFSSIATYNQHMKTSKKHVSEDDFKYMCSDCGKRFANKTRLKDHIDWEHLKNYTHICPLCQKAFKSHTSLYLHKQVVHKKHNPEHLCDHCGKAFPNKAKLRSHIIALHTTESPYKCDICTARFSWHSCLSRHVRRVHRTPHLKRRKNDL